MTNKSSFPSQDTLDREALEEGNVFSPRFNGDGLIVSVVLDAETDKLLMVAYMNDEALRETMRTGVAHYWSRSRAKLWRKGEESGNTQQLVEMRTDCDQDVIELRVKQLGAGVACHTGRYSCFYRVVESADGKWRLAKDEDMTPQFDPKKTYATKA